MTCYVFEQKIFSLSNEYHCFGFGPVGQKGLLSVGTQDWGEWGRGIDATAGCANERRARTSLVRGGQGQHEGTHQATKEGGKEGRNWSH